MKLSAKALAIVSAILWGGCILLVGLVNLVHHFKNSLTYFEQQRVAGPWRGEWQDPGE
jgi:hypothetical protein